METLQKLVSQWLWECMCYHPAILMFDDLDSVAGAGSSAPGQWMSEENNYYSR